MLTRIELASIYEADERAAAKERREATQGRPRKDEKLPEIFPAVSDEPRAARETRDVIGKMAGVSGRTVDKLEIGMHALKAVPKFTGGRGNKGGLRAYGQKLGKGESLLRTYRDAAEVLSGVKCADICALFDKVHHLACHTQEQIAEAVQMTQQAVTKVLQQMESFRFVVKPGEMAEIEDDKERMDAIEAANRKDAEHKTAFTAPIYNIWKRQDKTNGVGHFGNTEATWLDPGN